LISAWSAAASDVYISSRFLIFLARRGHAPGFLALLTRYPRQSATETLSTTGLETSALPSPDIARPPPVRTQSSHSPRIASAPSGAPSSTHHAGDIEASPIPEPKQKPSSGFVLPLASVVVSSSVGLLAYLSAKAGGPAEVSMPDPSFDTRTTLTWYADLQAFNWLGTVTSVASLQAWTGMLFTYVRCVMRFPKCIPCIDMESKAVSRHSLCGEAWQRPRSYTPNQGASASRAALRTCCLTRIVSEFSQHR
jgi:amino acid transporter